MLGTHDYQPILDSFRPHVKPFAVVRVTKIESRSQPADLWMITEDTIPHVKPFAVVRITEIESRSQPDDNRGH